MRSGPTPRRFPLPTRDKSARLGARSAVASWGCIPGLHPGLCGMRGAARERGAAGCPQRRLMEMGFKSRLSPGCGGAERGAHSAADKSSRNARFPYERTSAGLCSPARGSSAGGRPEGRAAFGPGRPEPGRGPQRAELRGVETGTGLPGNGAAGRERAVGSGAAPHV